MAERPRKKAKKSENSTPGSESSTKAEDVPRETNPLRYLNSDYLSAENAKKVASNFKKEAPFPHASLSGFLDDAFLAKVKQELLKKEEWYIKNNDLYTFTQTDDLKNTKQPHVRILHDIIYSKEFRNFMSTVTGIELNDTIDSFGSRYWQGSQLLCHDDELEGRRIAFIFYLVPKDWNEKDGGRLELFDVDKAGQPDQVVKSIVPKWNNFLFFEVSPVSFHQVAEVFTEDKERVAISGWFHGAPIKRPPKFVEANLPRALIKNGDKFNVSQWVNSRYLSAQIQKKVMNQFQDTSSIALTDFLTKAKYQEVEKALKAKDTAWKMIGPANRRHYLSLARGGDKTALQKLPAPVRDLMLFLRSPAFGELLCKLTGLDYVDEVQSEIRKFEPGCYTLAQDNTEQQKDEGLDAILYFCDNAKDDDWDDNLGGTTNYMSEDAELATLTPAKNSLCLLFRAGGDRVMRFVKYLRANAPSVIDIASVYYDTTSPPSAANDDDDDGEGAEGMDVDEDGEEDDEEEYEEDTRIPKI